MGPKNYKKKFTLSNDNIVVKTIFGQLPKNYKKEWKEFIKELIPKFDRIIWLDRKNMTEHCESFINLHYRSSLQQPTSVHKKWKMDDIPKSFNTEVYNKKITKALHCRKTTF